MELPKIVRQVGKIDNNRIVYIEGYVLDYLERFKGNTEYEELQVTLYGNRWNDLAGEINIVFGAAKRNEDESNLEDNVFYGEREVGCLNVELWKKGENLWDGILIGNGSGGQPIEGFYIFYEASEKMEDYLGNCYEQEMKRGIRSDKNEYNTFAEKKKENTPDVTFRPELIALSNEKELPEPSLYAFIRAIVICIFIILCAIAVTTINNFDKMNDFNQTAVEMSETMDD